MTNNKNSPLGKCVSKAIKLGVNELEIEYKDGCEEVFAMKHCIGVGIATFKSRSEEAGLLRNELYEISERKERRIRVGGTEYKLKVEIFDSFMEDAFRVTIEKS
jgi:hypothetical protein